MSLIICAPGPGGFVGALEEIELGKPYKCNCGKNGDPIYSQQLVVGDIEDISWETHETWSTVTWTGESILDSLHVNAHLGASFAVLSGSGDWEQVQTDFVRTSSKIKVKFNALRSKYYRELTQPRLCSEVYDALASGNAIDFLDKVGHAYVSRIYYGATCSVSCAIEGTERKEVEEIAAEMKSKIGMLPLSSRARVKLGYNDDKSNQTATATFHGEVVGVDVDSFTVIDRHEDVRGFISRFTYAYEHTDKTEMVPIAYELSRLDELLPEPSLSNPDISVIEVNLGTCNMMLADAIYLSFGLMNMHMTLSDEMDSFPQCREDLIPVMTSILKVRDTVLAHVSDMLAYRGQHVKEIMQHQPKSVPDLQLKSDFRNRIDELSGRSFLTEEETRQWLLEDLDTFPFGANLPQGMYYVGPVFTDMEKPRPLSELVHMHSSHEQSTLRSNHMDSFAYVWKKTPFLRGCLFGKGDKLFKKGSVRELKTAVAKEYANKEPPQGWLGWPQVAATAAAEKEQLIEENEQLRSCIRELTDKESALMKDNEQLNFRIKQLADQAATMVSRIGIGRAQAVHGIILEMQDGRRVGMVLQEDQSKIDDLHECGDRITDWFKLENEWIVRAHGNNSTLHCLCHSLILSLSSGRDIAIEPSTSSHTGEKKDISSHTGSAFSFTAGTNRMITDISFDSRGQVTGIKANDVPAALSQKTLTTENDRLRFRIRQLSVSLPPGVIVSRHHPYLCLDACRARFLKGTNVFVWETTGCDAQQMVYDPENGRISMRVRPDLCLDVYGGKFAPATNVQLWEANGSAAQQWDYDHETGIISLRQHPNLCLDICGAKFARGTNVYVWRGKGNAAQSWTVVGM